MHPEDGCIPAIQHLCLLGRFPKNDDWWFLWDLPVQLQRQVAAAPDPKAELDRLRQLCRQQYARRRTPPLRGFWDDLPDGEVMPQEAVQLIDQDREAYPEGVVEFPYRPNV
jgi:hypothetical protein